MAEVRLALSFVLSWREVCGMMTTMTTPKSDALCREIAKKSHGTCFLMFSGGKDSLAAWIYLRGYFDRIIPFHCASIPHLVYKDKVLDYYETMFQTRILRMMGEDLTMALARYMYQETPWECDRIDEELGDSFEDYNKLLIVDYLRNAYHLPKAWCAVGISANDSIDRRIYCNKTGGKNVQNKTFYPCWDWTRSQILEAMREAGVRLSPEYKYAKRSMGGVPSATYNKVLMEHFPQDWETTKLWYPLAEAKNVREKMIDDNYPLFLEQEARMRGGKADESKEDEGKDGKEGDGEEK